MTATFAPRATAATAKSPDVIAAVFYTDWCGYCKKMEPAEMATMKNYKSRFFSRESPPFLLLERLQTRILLIPTRV